MRLTFVLFCCIKKLYTLFHSSIETSTIQIQKKQKQNIPKILSKLAQI